MHEKDFIKYATFCFFIVTAKCPNVISINLAMDTAQLQPDPNYYDFSLSDEDLTSSYDYGEQEQELTDGNALGAGGDLHSDSKDWDVIIFTQQWPVTTCLHWREQDKDRACTLPSKKEFWTIHGIWPTKLGHLGPSFCNKSSDFDVTQLDTIVSGLNQYWPDIDTEDQFNWLWKHEWLKHGTCANQLPALDDELKYFGQGLQWRQRYILADILDSWNIHPDTNSTVIGLHMALIKGLGKNPSIHCVYEKKIDTSFLSEIRLCFDKSLELIDCDGTLMGDTVTIDYPGGTVITNCAISKPVHYPSLVPPVDRQRPAPGPRSTFRLSVVNIYKLLQFITWFTF